VGNAHVEDLFKAPLRDEQGKWSQWLLDLPAADRNSLMRLHQLNEQDVVDLKQSARRSKQKRARHQYNQKHRRTTGMRFLPFEEAHAFALSLGLKGQKGWQAWCKQGERPKNIPAAPDKHYPKDQWKGAF